MKARITTLKGVDAGAYYVELLPSYYLNADEPPGQWHGGGADMLGLRGEHATRTSSTSWPASTPALMARCSVGPRRVIGPRGRLRSHKGAGCASSEWLGLYAVGANEVGDVVRVEAHVSADLVEGNTSFGNEPSHKPRRHAKQLRHSGNIE